MADKKLFPDSVIMVSGVTLFPYGVERSQEFCVEHAGKNVLEHQESGLIIAMSDSSDAFIEFLRLNKPGFRKACINWVRDYVRAPGMRFVI